MGARTVKKFLKEEELVPRVNRSHENDTLAVAVAVAVTGTSASAAATTTRSVLM
jgi:hypothetical protein